jgi:hypothetical protein
MGSTKPRKGGLPVHPSVSEVLNEFISVKGSSPLENYLLKDMIEVWIQILTASFLMLRINLCRACPIISIKHWV